MRGIGIAVLALATALVVPGNARAQGPVGPTAIGVEAGLPLVLGVDASFRAHPRWRFGVGVGRLSGLTALRAEARWLVRPEVPRRVIVSLIAGAEQYFIEDGDRDATPVGVHVAVGFDYVFDSPVSIGIRIGGLKTFGSSDAKGARAFSVRNDYSSGMFSLGVRYHF